MFITAVPILVCLTVVCWLILPLFACLGKSTGNRPVFAALVGLGGVVLLAATIVIGASGSIREGLSGPHFSFDLTMISLGDVRAHFNVDQLSLWMLGIISLIAVTTSPYVVGYMEHLTRKCDMRLFWVLYPLLLAAMCLVVLASNVQTFLISWELMSLSSFALVITDRTLKAVREAGLIYLGATRAGTGLLAAGFLWAHMISHSWAFSDWRLMGAQALGPGLLVLAGLGLKAGMWPFHLWLPIAHPAAPAPVSALMSGVMVKVAVLVIVRLFVVDHAFSSPVFGVVLCVLGGIGAVWGILFALVQQDLKRLLALSTVENIGLILLSVGGCILAMNAGAFWAAQIALAAALLHMLNHAVFKSLLFLGAGSVDSATHTRDLSELGGLASKMPWTYGCFVVGAGCACAFPPLSGFSSEWLMYQAAVATAAESADPLHRFAGLLVIVLIALTGVLAAAVFVKAVGVGFQGVARSTAALNATEVGSGMRVSQIALVVISVLLGLSAPALLGFLQPIMSSIAPYSPPVATAWSVPLGPTVFVLILTAAALSLWLRSSRRKLLSRAFDTWDCGFGLVGPRAQVSGISLVQPLLRMFGAVFHYKQSFEIEGADKRHFPEEITAEVNIESVLEERIYAPFVKWFALLGGRVLAMQEGSIHRYLMTMLIALAVLLAIGGYTR